MRTRSAFILALAAPALAHAAGHGRGEAHRQQVAHMYAYEERQLGGLLGGGAPSSGASTTEEEESTSVPPRPSTSVDDESTTPTPTRSTPNPGPSSPTSFTGSLSGSGSMSVPSGTGLPSSSGQSMSGSVSPSASASSSASSSSQSTAPSSSSTTSATETTALTTDSAGKTITITISLSSASTSTSSPETSAAAGNNDTNDDGLAISKGAIIGIAVGVGAVVFGLIGMAIWRMKRRGGEEDEAIRWPELNRHGDSDAHHALPARQTGQHGIETSPLERSLTNGSDMYIPANSASTHQHHHMALGGSNFGASSALDAYDEKDMPNPHSGSSGAGYDAYEQYYAQQTQPQHPSSLQPHARPIAGAGAYDAYGNPSDNYASFPPQVGMQVAPGQGGPGMAYDSDSEGHGQVPMGQVGYGHGYVQQR